MVRYSAISDERSRIVLNAQWSPWQCRRVAVRAFRKNKALWKRRTHAISVQAPRLITAFIRRYFCAFTALLLRWRRCYWVATASLLRSYSALFRTRFEWRRLFWECSKCAPSVGVLCDATAMLLRCCGDACDPTALTSAFWIFFGRRENAALVWQRF
jgi:hypothetical protein